MVLGATQLALLTNMPRTYQRLSRAIHQENKGLTWKYGDGERNRKYFKVVDSDDWVDVRAYLKILEQRFETGEEVVVISLRTSSMKKKARKQKKIVTLHFGIPWKSRRVFAGWCEAASSWEIHDDALAIYNMNLLRKSDYGAEHTTWIFIVFVPSTITVFILYERGLLPLLYRSWRSIRERESHD